tara:strand:+ start:81 stop:395 length:315 start_codon:yes stop_codon:yes gene_type:complete
MSFINGPPIGTPPGRVGGGVFDGPGGGAGILQGAGYPGHSGIVSRNPPHKPVVDAPANKIGGPSPVVELLGELGVDPHKPALQNKVKLQKSSLNRKADPYYGLE